MGPARVCEGLETRRLLAASLSGAPSWTAQGPGPIHGGQAFERGTLTADVAGAINSIAADPVNPDRVFVGTVNGGVWRTTNATSPNPHWTPLTDQFPSLSIGDIKISPLNTMVIYAGIGQFSNNTGFNYGPGLLTGVLRSMDGGNTWVQLGRSMLGGFSVNRIVPTASGTSVGNQVVLAATSGGVFRSTDGGTTWNNLSGMLGSGLPTGGASDLVLDSGALSRMYVGIPGAGVFRSTDTGATWLSINNNIMGATASTRIRLTVQPNPFNGSNVVWAGLVAGGQVSGIFRSPGGTDGMNNDGDALTDEPDEATWTMMGPIMDGHGPTLHPGTQAATNFSLMADRGNPNVVFAGGDRQLPFGLEPNATGRLFRGDATRPFGSGQWDSIVNMGAGGFLGGSAPHADSRDMVFDADGNILECDDGGIWRLSGPNNDPLFRLWHPIHGDIQPTEFNSVSYDSLNNVILGGAQDVGSPTQEAEDGASWSEDFFRQADGGVTAVTGGIDAFGAFSVHYTTAQGLTVFKRQVTRPALLPEFVGLGVNGTAGLNLLSQIPIPGSTNTAAFDPTVQFYNPYVLNAVNPARMLIGTSFLYESFNQGDNLNPIGGLNATATGPMRNFGAVSAMSYGGFADTNNDGLFEAFPDVAWVGAGGNLFLRTTMPATPTTDNFTQVTAYTAAGGAAVRDLVQDPSDFRRLYVVDSNNAIWMTNNSGSNWANLSNNLPALVSSMNLPLGMVTIGLFTRRSPGGPNDDTLFVGGIGGVFRGILTPGSTAVTWSKFGLGLPNATVTDLQVSQADNLIVAGTAGRGAWKVSAASPAVRTASVLQINGDDGGVRNDIIRLVRNAANPLLLDVFVNSTLPVFTVPFAVPQQIVINGLGGNDTLTLDFSNGNFVPAGGISYDGGPNTGLPGDSLVVVGNSMLNGSYRTDGQISIGGQTITFQNLEPVMVSGFGEFAMVTDGKSDVISIDSPGSGLNRISGKTDGRVFEAMTFFDVSTLTLDLASNDSPGGSDDAVTIHTPGLMAFGLGVFNVNTGAGNDKLTVDAPGLVGTGALTFTGGGGSDTLTVTGEGDFLLQKNTLNLTGASGGFFSFADLEQVTLIGGKLSNTFTISGFAGPVSINGDDESDVLILDERKASGSTYALDNGLILKSPGAFSVSYANLETVIVNGGDGNDMFNVLGTGPTTSLSVGGGAGNDTIRLDGGGGTVDSIVSPVAFHGEAGNNNLIINDHADASGDIVHITRSSVGAFPGDTLFGPGGTLSYASTSLLMLNLGSGADTVYAAPDVTTALMINDAPAAESDGGPAAASPIDTLNLAFAGAVNPVFTDTGAGSGIYTFDNAQPLSYSGFESVKIDNVAPVVLKSFFAVDPLQTISFMFSEDVSFLLGLDGLTLTNLETGKSPATGGLSLNYDAASNTATFSFTKDFLPDGNYRARLHAGLPDLFGNLLASDTVVDFFVFAGDINRDRKVEFTDLVVLAQNYGTVKQTFSKGDFNYDGKVDFEDLVMLAQRYGTSLPAPAAGPMGATPATTAAALAPTGTSAGAGTSREKRLLFSTEPIHHPSRPPVRKLGRRKGA
jgi:hypothetical protein